MRDKRKLKTQVKENTTRPTWNEEFQLLIHEPDHQHLTLEMFDHDVLSVDDEIGRGSFAIRNLRNGIEEELEIEIKEQMGQQVDQMMVSASESLAVSCNIMKKAWLAISFKKHGRQVETCRSAQGHVLPISEKAYGAVQNVQVGSWQCAASMCITSSSKGAESCNASLAMKARAPWACLAVAGCHVTAVPSLCLDIGKTPARPQKLCSLVIFCSTLLLTMHCKWKEEMNKCI